MSNAMRIAAICSFSAAQFFCCSNDNAAPAPVGPLPGDSDTIVWVETPEIIHDIDYHSFADYVNPAFPENWLYPVNYAAGRFTLRVEVLELGEPGALPVYYTVGWQPGNAGETGFVRIAIRADSVPGVYQHTDYIKNAEYVVNGLTVSGVGEKWNWGNAWRDIAGDTWDMNDNASCYPMKVRVKVILHK